MPDIFLVNSNEQERLQLHEALNRYQGARVVSVARTGQEALLLLPNLRADIMIIRSNLPDMSGLDLAAEVQKHNSMVHIILTLVGDEPIEIWQRILELGIRNVITPPLDFNSVNKALLLAAQSAGRSTQERSSQSGRESFVVSVAGARGGVGKSIVAINLAHALSQFSDSVALLDFSGQQGDFSVMLDDVPRNTLADLLSSGDSIDADFLQTLFARHPAGFLYLASPPHDFEPAEFTRPLAREVVKISRQLSDYVIIDTGDPIFPATQPALLESDLILLVTIRDVVRLVSTQRYLQLMREWGVDVSRVKILVNQAEVGAEISDSEIESILEHPVAAYLPSNPGPATYSVNSGKALVTNDPKQPLAVVLNKLAELTWSRWDAKAQRTGDKNSGRGTSRLKSLLGRK
jgi:pilus assembly protein CpaE